MLCYPPSQRVAATIFLAKFILKSTKHPWITALAAEVESLQKDKEHLRINLLKAEEEVKVLFKDNILLDEENKKLVEQLRRERHRQGSETKLSSYKPSEGTSSKWVFHGWNDEACIKLLKRCKEAIPKKEKGGKALIIDKVMNTSDGVHPKLTETQLHFDIHMMVHTTGKQRTEEEWKKLFAEAGFKEYKIIPALGLRSIIEIYH